MNRLPYVQEYRDRHGKIRRYFRRSGSRRIPLPGRPGSQEFMTAYNAAQAGYVVREMKTVGKNRSAPGSLSAAIAAYYTERFGGLVVPPPDDSRRTHVFHQYVIRTPDREALRQHLAGLQVETGIHYPVPIHRQPAWRDKFGDSFGEGPTLPRAELAAREMLSLPVHPDLTDGEVEHVAESVVRFFG